VFLDVPTVFCSMSLLFDYMCMRLPFSPLQGVPSSQALPGFLITAPSSGCVPAVFSALTVRIQNPKKMEKKESFDLPCSKRLLRVH